MRISKKTIALLVPLIGALGVIVAALIQSGVSRHEPIGAKVTVIARMVVDQNTNEGIGQAAIRLAGRDEQYTTEDSGNFRITLNDSAPSRVRLHISKVGYVPRDESVQAPTEGLIVQLHKQ